MELTWNPEVSEHIEKLVPYPPGKPIEETEREFGLHGVVKLASNENPLGPSPKALEALNRKSLSLHLYPDGSHYRLKKALSERLGVSSEELCIGNGSNEFLDILPRAFVNPERNIVTHQAAFVIYKLCAQLQGCGCKEVPLAQDLTVNVDSLLSAVDQNTRLVVLANPNNPTGAYLNKEEVERLASELLAKKVLLVLDYAYWEYVTEPSIPDPIEVYKKYPNVLVLRTFSKIYGLAGLRVGYLVANKKVISTIEKIRQPFNVSSPALEGALAALEDEDFVRRSRELNTKSLGQISVFLKKYPFTVYPSQGNFILVDMKKPSKDLYVEFLKRGVIIRPVSNYGFHTHFRISAGLEEENKKLFNAVESIFGAPKA